MLGIDIRDIPAAVVLLGEFQIAGGCVEECDCGTAVAIQSEGNELAVIVAAGLIDDLHGRPDIGRVSAGVFQLMRGGVIPGEAQDALGIVSQVIAVAELADDRGGIGGGGKRDSVRARAAFTSSRGKARPVVGAVSVSPSRLSLPLARRMESVSVGVRVGSISRISAAVPATIGAAKLVPSLEEKPARVGAMMSSPARACRDFCRAQCSW